jgi:predicted membrane protein DUF2142
VFLLCLAWDAASPLFAPPDESAHVIRAAALAHEQLTGADSLSPYGWVSRVWVPSAFPAMQVASSCFHDAPNRTPNCAGRAPTATGLRATYTGMGRYPPLYYLIIAPFTRVSSPRVAVYLMRLVTAVLCAAFLASALVSAQVLGTWAVLGVAAAITPMVLYFGGVVNPSGLEIASAVCLWATMTAIARGPGPESRLVVRATIAFVVFANTRSLSIPMAAVATIAPLLVATRPRVVEVLRSHAVRVAGGVALVATAAGFVWIELLGRVPSRVLARFHFTVADGLGRTWRLFGQSVAWFGFFEVRDVAAILIWAAAWGALLLLSLYIGSLREGLVLIGVVLVAIAVPIAVSLVHPAPIFTTWQGRHGLPLWVGLPILAGAIVSEAPPRRTRVATGVIAAGLAYGQISAFATAAHRYTVGSGGQRLYFVDPVWSGIVPPIVLLLVVVATCATFAVLTETTAARRGRRWVLVRHH